MTADKKEFNDKFAEYQKHLPEQAESRASTSGKQEQQQEQQQQQQQQSISQSQTSRAKDREVEFSSELRSRYVQPGALDYVDNDSSAIRDFSEGWGIDDVWMTHQASKIIDLMPRMSGDPWCKICVNNKGQVILLSKQDYHAFSTKGGLRMVAPLQKGNVILKGSQPLTELEIKRVAVLKLQLGFTEFPKDELQQLKIWWQNLKPEDKTRITVSLEKTGFNIELLEPKKTKLANFA